MSEHKTYRDFLLAARAEPVAASKPPQSHAVVEFSGDKGSIQLPDDVPEGKALEFLEAEGQNPNEWEVTGFRRIEYGNPASPFISTRFTYKRRETAGGETVPYDDLVEIVKSHEPAKAKTLGGGAGATAVLIGDNQFGKGLEDPYEAIEYALSVIDQTAESIASKGRQSEILVAWLGDHIEGFVSQGGANIWRTRLTLTDQIRATRRVMMYALEAFAPLCDRLIMAAVPGNHGQTHRPNGKGITRYDDNHDTECLVAVADAVSLAEGDAFAHVTFLIPEEDHLSLTVKVGGLNWGLVHGDKWRAGKHFDWWGKQAFGGMPLAAADVLACGHWHHLHIEEQGNKLFIQVPALETESMWFSHLSGIQGNPGLVVVHMHDGAVISIEPVRVK